MIRRNSSFVSKQNPGCFSFLCENRKKIFDKSSHHKFHAVGTTIGPIDSHLAPRKDRYW